MNEDLEPSESRFELSWRRFGQKLDAEPLMWPDRIRMLETIRPYDGVPAGIALELSGGKRLAPAVEFEEYEATSNRLGAVCAVVDGELLGVKPAEFEVVAWRQERRASEKGKAKQC